MGVGVTGLGAATAIDATVDGLCSSCRTKKLTIDEERLRDVEFKVHITKGELDGCASVQDCDNLLQRKMDAQIAELLGCNSHGDPRTIEETFKERYLHFEEVESSMALFTVDGRSVNGLWMSLKELEESSFPLLYTRRFAYGGEKKSSEKNVGVDAIQGQRSEFEKFLLFDEKEM
jgi:hypothetical protein